VSVSYDEANLVSAAGVLPAAALAQKLGLAELIDTRLRLDAHGANSATKALSVIGTILAGGDSIDDVALLRAGAMPELFDQNRAPSTVGTWLRSFRWSNARELDAITRELLARLWAAGAGPADPGGPLTIDLDSTICEVHGRAKQGAGFGYTKVRGYHPQLATCAETGQVIFSRLRGGAAAAARGADSLLAESVSRLRAAGAGGPLTVRADSAFYARAVLSTAARLDVRFSITIRHDRKVARAIAEIPDDAWTPIPYWLSTPEVSGADVAEIGYTCFAGRDARPVRLIVRRTRPTPGSQLALLETYSYHALVTDRPGEMLELEADHRRHAVIEQSIAELKAAGLAHLPSGKFNANAAWLSLAIIAHNLARAVGALGGQPRATTASIGRRLIRTPGRLVHHAGRLSLRLPQRWPWAQHFATAWAAITALPAPG
jgi:hypothetical protein